MSTRSHSAVALAERALLLCRSALEGVELRTRFDYAGDIECAGPFVVQVLVNLIENAAQAAGEGGWVAVTTTADDRAAYLRVQDSAGGVPDKLRDKVFQPFFTTKPPGVGTGLGLPVARRIVEQHGGRLRVVAVDGGSLFEAMFPRGATAATQ